MWRSPPSTCSCFPSLPCTALSPSSLYLSLSLFPLQLSLSLSTGPLPYPISPFYKEFIGMCTLYTHVTKITHSTSISFSITDATQLMEGTKSQVSRSWCCSCHLNQGRLTTLFCSLLTTTLLKTTHWAWVHS